jgi:hypothetical protein
MASTWRNTPENIVTKAKPLLEPGEVVAHVVRAMDGPPKFLGLVIGLGIGALTRIPLLGILAMWLVFTRLYARRILLATDRNLVVLAGGRWRFTPKKVLARLDIDTRIGPMKGIWFQTTIAGRKLYIVPRTVQEARDADAEIDTA